MKRIKKVLQGFELTFRLILFIFATSLLLAMLPIKLPFEFMLALTPLLMLYFSYTYINNDLSKERRERFGIESVIWGLIGFVIAIISNLVASKLIITSDFTPTSTASIMDISNGAMILIVGLLAPLAEELTFRLVYKDYLMDKLDFSKLGFVIISSLAFSILHVDVNANLVNNLGIIFITGLSGIGFAYVYLKSDNIYSSIIAHMLYNLLIISII